MLRYRFFPEISSPELLDFMCFVRTIADYD